MNVIPAKVRDIIVRYRLFFLTLLFLLQAALANYLSFLLRFESMLPSVYLNLFLTYLPILLSLRFVFFLLAGLYKGVWRYASINDLMKIINSTTFGSIAFFLIVRYGIGDVGYPRSIYVLDCVLCIVISGGGRLFIRVLRESMIQEPLGKKTLIIGAGDAGEMIVREMKSHKHTYTPIGFVDDDPRKKGLTIHGVPVLGQSHMIPELIEKHKPDEILISSPDIQKTIKDIYELCKPFNVRIKKLPGIQDLLGGNVSVAAKIGQRLIDASLITEAQVQEALTLQKKEGGRLGSKLVKLGYITEEKLFSFLRKHLGISHIKPISLEDLLQREPVNTDIPYLTDFIKGKSVMVTGAGGSIGSELCRQLIKYSPSILILLDRYENNIYEVDISLRAGQHRSSIVTVIGDVQDAVFLDHVFSKHKPQIIFHAAAYKHVPLMEHNPIEAVKNNIFGTKNLIDAAARHCAENFVLISTDKAVNPTSIMGATKRISEFLTVNMTSFCKTKFSVVRFGNVLGSNGSVVPLFSEQLKRGGPLTVTHPEVKRFFMLIPEAVHLVLIAAASGKGGEIFVLDMGDPIKIIDLTENFIRLSGFIPHKEIKIVYTGLRPGEKMCEELFDESETRVAASHKKLMIAVPQVPSMAFLFHHLLNLERVIEDYAEEEVVPLLQMAVPTFRNHVLENTPKD